MDDQQERKSILRLAWLAGMFNGDGCFSLTFRKRKDTLKCDLSLTITQCDPSIIEEVTSILNDYLDINPGLSTYNPSGAGTNIKYNLRISKMSEMLKIINSILPNLVGNKKAQAALMKRYIDRRNKFSDPSLRKSNKISDDKQSLQLGFDFYTLRNKKIPKEIKTFLND